MAKVRNLDRLKRRLAEIRGAPRKAIREALGEAAQDITRLQRRLVPKKSGKLESSIDYTFGNYKAANANVRGVTAGGVGDPDLSVVIHAGDADAFYAAWVEHGTDPHRLGGKFKGAQHPGSAAKPFFYPAYRALKKQTKSKISRATSRSIREAAKK